MAPGQSDPEEAIRALSDAFVQHFNAGDGDRLVEAVYSEDARLFPPNQPMIAGKPQIKEAYRELLGNGMGGLTIETFVVDVADSGDLAYGFGTFSLSRPAPDRGKFVEVYRRQLNGSWRCVVDMFSSDQADA